MDDYSINSLTESKNEWCARLVSILTTSINQGINSIYDEAEKLCVENDEINKYLMTFQNLLSTIPNWNPTTIENERKRIEQVTGCKYLEELITCVHIIQLKALTCIRVGQKQKKIDIDIPSIDKFIHQIYINTARNLYTSIYLFEKDIYPLQQQKNKRELEILIKEAILLTIRDNIPVEDILRVYMAETEEQEVIEEKPHVVQNIQSETLNDLSNNKLSNDDKLDVMAEKIKSDIQNKIIEKTEENKIVKELPIELKKEDNKINETNIINKDSDNELVKENISTDEKMSIDFSNIDNIIDGKGIKHDITAPKDIQTLENIAAINNAKRAAEDAEDDDSDILSIGDDVTLSLDEIDLSSIPTLDIETL
tara:strand:+ start:788 stop:1888 length:1101 start_codon:yes stop_codon:yes gene_type:complete